MAKTAISLTIEQTNLLWLKGRARIVAGGNLSEAVDQLITEARAGKINLRRTPRAFFGDLFSNAAYQPFELTQELVFDADELRFNRDPFDALIVASARALALPLVTRDVDILESGAVKTIW
jgi:PIN domain nuclease of toxin-antitoxin system